MHQIEKKYLLKNSIETLINDLRLTKEEISIFFTNIKVCKEVKYSKIGSKYYKIVKTGIIDKGDQSQKEIEKSKYLKAKKNSIGYKIKKSRYQISSNDEKQYIDKYHNNLENFYLLVVIFEKNSDKDKFELPDTFKHYVIKDITRDEKFKDRNLALFGDSEKKPYNIYTIFKDLEHGRTTDIKKIIFNKMKTSDAARIMLYKLFIDLRIAKNLIVQTDAKEGLREFKMALKKSRILIKEHKKIFDKDMVQKVISHLRTINKALSTQKNLEFIQKELDNLDSFIDPDKIIELQDSISQRSSFEKHKICRFFKTREFTIIFKQYELLLKESNKSFLKVEAQTSIQNFLKHKIFMNYKKIVILCEKYEGCKEQKSRKAIKKSFQTLKVLLQEFDMIKKNSKNTNMYKITDTILKKLTNIQNFERRKEVLNTYLENLKTKPENYKKLLKTIEIESNNAITAKTKELHKAIGDFIDQKFTG